MMILNDASGKPSTMRLLVIFVVMVYTLVWAWLSIKDQAMYEIDIEQVTLIVGLFGAKAVQAFAEQRGKVNDNG